MFPSMAFWSAQPFVEADRTARVEGTLNSVSGFIRNLADVYSELRYSPQKMNAPDAKTGSYFYESGSFSAKPGFGGAVPILAVGAGLLLLFMLMGKR